MRSLKNISRLLPAVALGLLVSACGATITSSPQYSAEIANATFSANDWRAHPEFSASANDNNIAPYDLINAEYAYEQGYTGAGKIIAVFDQGFLTSHSELNGKVAGSFDAISIANHGTHVASIAAGARDNAGILGVAHGAKLYLATVFDSNDEGDPRRWAAATRAAGYIGAVVQNNSWNFDGGFSVYLARETQKIHKASAAKTLSILGNAANKLPKEAAASAAEWEEYIDAMLEFQKQGVIVRTLANDASGALRVTQHANLSAALPELDHRLGGAWIAVGNIEVSEENGNRKVSLNSAPCGETARYCLVADGTRIKGAGAEYNADFVAATGTSFSAPQISGALAILAEAFPHATPRQLAAHLLATADNSFFEPDGYSYIGGVRHGYSKEFGHGIVDLKRALAQPINSHRAL